jgi:hypothetical protein
MTNVFPFLLVTKNQQVYEKTIGERGFGALFRRIDTLVSRDTKTINLSTTTPSIANIPYHLRSVAKICTDDMIYQDITSGLHYLCGYPVTLAPLRVNPPAPGYALLTNFQHPYIVPVMGFCLNRSADPAILGYFLLAYQDSTSTHDLLNPSSPWQETTQTRLTLLTQLLMALRYLHGRGVCVGTISTHTTRYKLGVGLFFWDMSQAKLTTPGLFQKEDILQFCNLALNVTTMLHCNGSAYANVPQPDPTQNTSWLPATTSDATTNSILTIAQKVLTDQYANIFAFAQDFALIQ